jgi:hypothetical protein
MKKLHIIIALLFASVQLEASHQASQLNLRMADNAWFTATVGHQAHNTPVTRLRLEHLAPGSHYIRVFRHDLSFFNRFGAPVQVFAGFVEIPAASKVNAMIDRHFRFRINKITPLWNQPVYHQPVIHHPVVHHPVVTPVYHYAMNDHDFGNLVYTISRLSFESSRVQIARQAIANNYFTAHQVAELMRLMTFESTKLDIAKQAYHKTVDQNNYYLINDLFTFESSIMDLNNYIFRG